MMLNPLSDEGILTEPQYPEKIKNHRPPMQYRRFGRTEEYLSVITLGGMRFIHGGKTPREEVPAEMEEECRKNVEWAFRSGINHIETAHAYGKSEYCYGKVLNQVLKIPRNNYYLMTKGWPKTAAETRRHIEEQLKGLQTDYFDFYAWHGINDEERKTTALAKNGPVMELLKLKEEGIIKHVGFSTHGPLSIILAALQTDLFDFVNLHYYYFFQRNRGAIALAEEKDIGVFIISPNDKGGQLFRPYPGLRALTQPLTPIQWNARFCLSHKGIHTLSFGMTEESHYREMMGIFPAPYPMSRQDKEIHFRLDQQAMKDPYSDYSGYDMVGDPSGINIPEILRFRKMWKCYGMDEYVIYRYNMMDQASWFPGNYPTPEVMDKIDMKKVPPHIPLKAILAEVHENFYKPPKT